MKRGNLITIGFLAALAVVGALVMVVLSQREPSVQGKSLSQWMAEYERVMSASPVSKEAPPVYPSEAVEAIRSMGQPAVDALLDRMSVKDPAWKLKLIGLAQKQSLIKVNFERADVRRGWAVSVLVELGPSVSNAVPTLIEWLSDDVLENSAQQVLASIGRASVEPLRARLAHEDPKVRLRAALILGWIGSDAAPAVPALVNFLSETNRAMRSAVIRGLGAIGQPRDEMEQRLIAFLHAPEDALDGACGLAALSSNTIPVLIRALTNEHAKVRLAGTAGMMFLQEIRLGKFIQTERNWRQWNQRQSVRFNLKALTATFRHRSAGEDKWIVFGLIPNLQDPDPRVRELSAAMLAGFPTEAGQSVPALKRCLQDPDATVRATVGRSLEQLPKPPPVEAGPSLKGTNSPAALRPRPSGQPPLRRPE